MKHFRIELHIDDPKAYEAVEALAQRVRAECERGLPEGTAGYGVYVAAFEQGDSFDFPIIGNEAEARG